MEKPNITNNYYAPIGQKIDYVDTINVHFDKDMQMHIDQAEQIVGAPQPADSTTTDLHALLLPIFFGNEKEVETFLRCIQTMKPREITRMVNGLVRKRIISADSCKGDLWQILHDYGLYNRLKRTWNDQVIG